MRQPTSSSCVCRYLRNDVVIPAHVGIRGLWGAVCPAKWIPACAGMTIPEAGRYSELCTGRTLSVGGVEAVDAESAFWAVGASATGAGTGGPDGGGV